MKFKEIILELENSQKLRQLPHWSSQDELAMRVIEVTQLKRSTNNGIRMAGGTYLTKVHWGNKSFRKKIFN